MALGTYVLFCDADDEVAPGWVQAMADGLRDADIVGGPLDLRALNTPLSRAWRVDEEEDGLPRTMGFLLYAVGANFGVRANVLRRLGGFDETYVRGHEEVEFCWRAQLASYRLAFVPTASVRYRLRHDLRGLARQRYGYGFSYAKLFMDYRDRGITAGSSVQEVQTWARLLLTTPRLLTTFGRGRWVYVASWNAGRLWGSLAHRALCPR